MKSQRNYDRVVYDRAVLIMKFKISLLVHIFFKQLLFYYNVINHNKI